MTTPTAVQTDSHREVPRAACSLGAMEASTVQFSEAPAGQGAEGAQGDAEPGGHRFTMEPALFGHIPGHWFWGELHVDLEGLELPSQVPALFQHDHERRVGFTDRLELVEGVGVVAEGPMLRNAHADQIRMDASQGYPWQASPHLTPLSIEDVQAGATVEVNGQQVPGPATVFRRSRLREVSFVAIGADPNTKAGAFQDQGTVHVPTTRRVETMTKKTDGAAPAQGAPAGGNDVQAAAGAATPDAAATERTRVSAILADALPEQRELAQRLITEGVELADARQQLLADLRERFSASRAPQAPGTQPGQDETSLATPPAPRGAPTADTTLGARPQGMSDDAWAAWCSMSAEDRTGIYFDDPTLFEGYAKARKDGRLRAMTPEGKFA